MSRYKVKLYIESIEVIPGPGSVWITDAAEAMIEMAKKKKCMIWCDFNDTRLECKADTDLDTVVKDWFKRHGTPMRDLSKP